MRKLGEQLAVLFLLTVILGCGGKGSDGPAVATPPPQPGTPTLKEFIVAPNGLAGNPGTLAAPTTLDGARSLVRNAARSGPGALRVTLRGGIYPRSSTFTLSATDSGSTANPVEYVAYPGEKPRLIGGVALNPASLHLADSSDPNWSRLDPTARSQIYVADLVAFSPSLGSLVSRSDSGGTINQTMEVFADGAPLTFARYPKAVDPETVNLAPQATLQVSGSITPDATGDYTYKGLDSRNRPYYQLAKGGDVWSIAASASGPEWYLSNRTDLGGTGPATTWGTYENFAGPVGRFDAVSGLATGSAILGRADGSISLPGFLLIRSTNGTNQIAISDSRMARWRSSEAMYYGQGKYSWSGSHSGLASLDPATGVMVLSNNPTYGLRIGQPFFLYNLLEELTAPGDCFIDRVNTRLYLRPIGDVPPTEVLLSTLQTPILQMQGCQHVTWQGVSFEAAKDRLVIVKDCQAVAFANCQFRNAGGEGLLLSGYSNLVEACEFSQLGKGGIWVSGGDRHTLAPSGTVIENCKIHHYGRLFWNYQPGININSMTDYAYSDDCNGITVQHNEIHHAPQEAIIFQGNNHTIRYNHIHQVCQWSNDAGAIYSQRDWGSQGNTLQYNLIRNGGGPFGAYILGIYVDACASGITIEGNILFKSGPTMAIQHNGGRDVKIRYNIMSGYWFGARSVNYGMTTVNNIPGSSMNLLEKLNHFSYQSNPWAAAYPTLADIPNDWSQIQGSHWLQPENCVFFGNLFQGYSSDVIRQENVYPAMGPPLSWFSQISGNLSQADPMFTDVAQLDFRLKPGSPMYGIPGFPGIDVSKIGVQQ